MKRWGMPAASIGCMLFLTSCGPDPTAIAGALGGSGLANSVQSVTNLVQTLTGKQAKIQGAQMQAQSLINSLNTLQAMLPNIQSAQVGRGIYDNLNNAVSTLTGQSSFAPLTTQYPTVDVVMEQIAEMRAFVQAQENNFQYMSEQDLQQYTLRLQQTIQVVNAAASMQQQQPPQQMGYMPQGGGYGNPGGYQQAPGQPGVYSNY